MPSVKFLSALKFSKLKIVKVCLRIVFKAQEFEKINRQNMSKIY